MSSVQEQAREIVCVIADFFLSSSPDLHLDEEKDSVYYPVDHVKENVAVSCSSK